MPDPSNDDVSKLVGSTGLKRFSSENVANTLKSQSADNLLEKLAKRLTDEYRNIKFVVPPNHTPPLSSQYSKRVSFDTVDIQFDDSGDDDDFDDLDYEWDDFKPKMNDYTFLTRGRERMRDASPARYSPFGSPSNSLSPSRRYPIDEVRRRLSEFRPAYPTRPIITHKGCSFTKVHNKFEDLYLRKLYNEKNNWLKPILPLRIILVYLSGRKHTWVALDWIVRRFIENGDTVVVVSSIGSIERRRGSRFLPQKNVKLTPEERFKQRSRPEHIKFIANNIMTYIMEVMNPNVIAKVSVELVVGKTKDILKDMYKLYEPNLVCTGSKLNTRNSAPLKSWLSSRLLDRLVKNFPLPVIVVPASNMGPFEDALELAINSKFESGKSLLKKMKKLSLESSSSTSESDSGASDTESIDSGASMTSLSSKDSYSSFGEITDLYVNYKKDLSSELVRLSEQPVDENYFANYLKPIADKSSALCRDIKDINPDFRGKGAKLARMITGSNSFGVVPFKTKSLLDPVETKTSNSEGKSYKELREYLKSNAAHKVSSPPPQILVHSPSEPSESSESEARKPSLKFVDLDTPHTHKEQKNYPLRKLLSHEINSVTKPTKPKLEPSKSEPELNSIGNFLEDKSNRKKKSSKKKKFWKLFI